MAHHVTVEHGIPVTTVARTLVDLGDVVNRRAVEIAVEQAEVLRHPFHRTRQSRERDARRDQLLRLNGYEPLRFTGRQVALDKEWVARTMLALACRADGDRSGRAGTQAA